MGKGIGKIAAGIGLVALAATGVGAIAASAIAFGVGVTGTALATIGTIASGLLLKTGISTVLGGLSKPTGANAATLSRLTLTFDPNALRKMVFGETAMGTDVVYWEPSGTNQEYVDYIIVCAAHEVQSIDTIYTDGTPMWTLAGGVQGIYVGYLTVDVRTVGTAANAIAINGGTTWSTACRLTGCAYVHLRIKRTGSSSKVDSPFSGGLPGQMAIVGKGMKIYDPRRDSTNGGSGSHRPGTQSTWEYTSSGTELGQNHALQALAVLLGWRIGGVVSVGGDMAPARIDFADYITAANICDEMVADGSGGTHRRYEGAGIFADGEAPAAILDVLCLHMNAEMRDRSGKLGIRIGHDDLTALPTFTDADVLGAYDWDQYPSLIDTPNIVRGKYIDATTNGLYQLAPYTPEKLTSPDGIDRPSQLDLQMCQHPIRAARIARQVLRRGWISGTYTAPFGPRALGVEAGDPVSLTFSPAGISAQSFRVISQSLQIVLDDDAARAFCPMTLQAEDPWIYEWDGIATAPGAAVPAVAYNPQNSPAFVKNGADIGVANGATKNVVTRSGTAPASPVDGVDIWIDTSVTPNVTKYRVAGAWQPGANYVTQGTDIGVENGADVTASNAPDLTGNFAWGIDGDVAGNVTTTLPTNRRYIGTEGGVDVSPTTSFVLSAQTSGMALTVNNTPSSADRGLVTMGTGQTGSGTAKLTATLPSGGVVERIITVTKTNAVAPATGAPGATFAQDTSFANVTSGSHANISDELIVRSDGSNHVRIAATAVFNASASADQNIAVKFSYATSSGGSLTDLISEVTANFADWVPADSTLYDGDFSIAEATFTMPAPNTDYYFRLRARRITGSATIVFNSANFTVRQ